jgi:tetratricopeptide (TPR) repeat protein
MALWAASGGPHTAAAPRTSPANQRSAAAHFQRGLELSLQENWPGAEVAYREAVRLDPQNAKYRSHLADALAAQGKFEKAQQSSQQGKRLRRVAAKPAARRRSPAPKATRPAPRLTSQPTPPRSAARTATAGRAVVPPSSAAGGRTATTTRRSPEDPSVEITLPEDGPFSQVHPSLEQATLLSEAGKWSEAEAAFRVALRRHPKLDEGWNGLGDVCFKQNKWRDAAQAYREAMRLRPEHSYYHAQLAGALLKLDRRDEAMREALEAARLGLEDHEVFDELGITVTLRKQ